MKKAQNVGVILILFIITVAPCISQSVVKASPDDDLVEVTNYQDFNQLNGNETPRYPKLLAFVVLIL